MKNLYDELKAYADSDYYGFHMPGHKRNRDVTGAELPYEIDITEIEGFDDLHHAGGILKQAQERAAKVFHAEESCFLVNGSTAGILSAILGCTQRGDRILVARNCHKSVYHAIYMNELEPVYLYPEYKECGVNGAVSPEEVRQILQQDLSGEDEKKEAGHGTIRAVVITSPTYDGIVSDIGLIAGIVHSYKIPLIVDEAHGAHFGFHPYFPENANTKGADVVIHSIHKTLPSLTQTALIHMNGALADRERIKRYLHIVQTSSPSYVLMAGMDACIGLLDSTKMEPLFENYVRLLRGVRGKLGKMRYLHLVDLEETKEICRISSGYILQDYSKILISVKDTKYSGKQLYDRLLQEYHLQMEMAAGSYVLAMTSAADTEEGFARLVEALLRIDEELDGEDGEFSPLSLTKACGRGEHGTRKESRVYSESRRQEKCGTQIQFALPRLERIYSSAQMDRIVYEISTARQNVKRGELFSSHNSKSSKYVCTEKKQTENEEIQTKTEEGRIEMLRWELCAGVVSTEYAYLYPPGIPLIVPGERISEEVIALLKEYKKMGFRIEGLKKDGYIEVYWQKKRVGLL